MIYRQGGGSAASQIAGKRSLTREKHIPGLPFMDHPPDME